MLTLSQLITNCLTVRLGWIQRVEAYNLRGLHTSATTVLLPFKSITSLTYTMLNGTIVTPDATDLTNGTITISSATQTDDIDATYVFQYFSTSDLQQFYLMAMSRLNAAPPKSGFWLDDGTVYTTPNYPDNAVDFLTIAAYKMCLETILIDLMGWKARLIWADPVALAGVLQGVISTLENELLNMAPLVKGRNYITPMSVSAGRYKIPSRATEFNFQAYSIIGPSTGG